MGEFFRNFRARAVHDGDGGLMVNRMAISIAGE